jgi:uncharacterized protein
MIAGRMEAPREHSDLGDLVVDGRGGAVLRVRVKPRSKRRGVFGLVAGELSVGVGAPPEGGRANTEALGEVAAWLGLPPSRLSLASGAASRSKRILVSGEGAAALRRRVASRLRPNPR